VYTNSVLRICEKEIHPYLVEYGQTTFSVLRMKMQFLSALTYATPNNPRFYFDPSRTTFSIDGDIIAVQTVHDSVHRVLKSLEADVKALCMGADVSAVWEHIDSKLDHSPENHPHWFKESIQNEQQGYSFVQCPQNALNKVHHVLLKHFSKRGTMFRSLNGSIVAISGMFSPLTATCY